MVKQVDLEALAWQVAEAKRPNRAYHPNDAECALPIGLCPDCGGEANSTGEVLRFPEMSQGCLKCGAAYGHKADKDCCVLPHNSSQDDGCHGTGRVPVEPHLEILWASLREASLLVEVQELTEWVPWKPASNSVKDIAEEYLRMWYQAAVKVMEASNGNK